jgi:hypothetical protein
LTRALVLALFVLLSSAAGADEPFARTEEREPCARHDPLRRPFFGDTHVHTRFSFDAWGQGTLAGPREAYRFARGEAIGMQPYDEEGRPGAHIQLRRPLDYAVVTDHSDLMGEAQICQDPELPGHGSVVCRVVRTFPMLGYMLVNGHVYSSEKPARYGFCGTGGARCIEAGRGPWEEIQAAAEAHYDRSASCRFTTFVGYEWTGMPGGSNVHRNVVFRNAVVQDYPTTYIETPTQEELWATLGRECLDAGTGCDAIAIPHNSNVSNGLLFTIARPDGTPIDAAEARTRARLETLVEVTQHKGDSECRPGAEDELCDYEMLGVPRMMDMATSSGVAPEDLAPRIFVREVLTEGLVQARRLGGANPFQFGLIGATDTHLAAPGMVDEDQFRGHAAGPVSLRYGARPYPDVPFFNPGGLGVIWAEENSRDALFAAMRRRETYGTTGPRLTVRFFGGWDYPDDLCGAPDFAAQGYAGGVPMGAVMKPSQGEGASRLAPHLAVWALRDPGDQGAPSAPLQRIQIVKGWVDGEGAGRERVHEVAGDPDNGADVDLSTCQPRGAGADELCAVWTDPDFDPDAPAYYYARVVENPSCRWNQWACNAAGVDCAAGRVPEGMDACCDPEVPRTIRERAWTSPIWYAPW